MRVVIEAASLSLTSGGLARYTTELSLALARLYPDDEFYLISDQPFALPQGAPANLKRGGGPRNAVERRWWLWGITSELGRLRANLIHGRACSRCTISLRGSIPGGTTPPIAYGAERRFSWNWDWPP